MKNLHEGGSGCAAQCFIRFVNLLLISCSVSAGVAVGPRHIPKYLPLDWEVSMDVQLF